MKYWMTFLVGILFSFSAMALSANAIKVRGKVLADFEPIKVGTILKEGQIITPVDENSFVHIRFSDGSSILIKNGSVALKKLNKKETLISLLRGTLFAHKNKKSKTLMNIKTKRAALGVRGTKFFVDEKNNETYLCVCEGVVRVEQDGKFLNVLKDEDFHIKRDEIAGKTKASKQMLDMAWDGFSIMGLM